MRLENDKCKGRRKYYEHKCMDVVKVIGDGHVRYKKDRGDIGNYHVCNGTVPCKELFKGNRREAG